MEIEDGLMLDDVNLLKKTVAEEATQVKRDVCVCVRVHYNMPKSALMASICSTFT